MKKIVKISIFIAVLALIGLLVFLGYRYVEYTNESDINYGYYDFSKEKITENIKGDYKTFSIKRIGLEFETPSDWISTTENGPLVFKNEYIDVEVPLKDFREWTSGCLIDISLEKDTDFDGFSNFDYNFLEKENLKIDKDTYCAYDHCSVDIINAKEFLKHVFEVREDELEITFQMITFTYFNEEKREILRVTGYLSSQVPECEEHLNHFIDTLKFN